MAVAIGEAGLLPAPAWRRAGEFVFVSSILPVDADGRLARPERSGWAGESEVAAQAEAVMDRLARVLAEAGSGLDRLVRTEVQLADAADFLEFRLAYVAALGSHTPASCTIVVGDEHLLDGARLSLDAVALVADAPAPQIVTAADAPDPTPTEHAAQAVKAGPFVFCSAMTAGDQRSGLAVSPTPGGYHDSAPRMQAAHVVGNLERVLAAAGSSLEQGLKVQFYEPDLRTFPIVDQVWGEAVGVPPSRSSMACRDLLVPGAVWAVNLIALAADAGLEKRETRAGIAWHPADSGKANFSPGIRAGEWLFTAGQIPVPDLASPDWVGAPAGMPHHFSDIEIQADYTLGLLRDQLDANGFGFDDVVDARVYLIDPQRDYRGFARAWERAFPADGPRPALSIVPSTQRDGSSGVLLAGPRIEIDLTSWRAEA